MAEYLLYILVMAITPGPNTILSLQNASEKGLKKGIKLNWGMFTGISILTVISYLLVSVLSRAEQKLNVILQVLGIVYMLYLAWKMYSKTSQETEDRDKSGSFRTGLMMQFLNVKVIMLVLSAISVYVIPSSLPFLQGFLMSLLIPFVCFLAGLAWAVAGDALKGVYLRHTGKCNTIFALSLFLLAVNNIINLIKSVIH